MNSEEVFETLKDLIVEQLGDTETPIMMESSLKDDLEADSFDIVEIIMSIEEEFDIVFSDEDVMKFVIVGDIVDLINKLLV